MLVLLAFTHQQTCFSLLALGLHYHHCITQHPSSYKARLRSPKPVTPQIPLKTSAGHPLEEPACFLPATDAIRSEALTAEKRLSAAGGRPHAKHTLTHGSRFPAPISSILTQPPAASPPGPSASFAAAAAAAASSPATAAAAPPPLMAPWQQRACAEPGGKGRREPPRSCLAGGGGAGEKCSCAVLIYIQMLYFLFLKKGQRTGAA